MSIVRSTINVLAFVKKEKEEVENEEREQKRNRKKTTVLSVWCLHYNAIFVHFFPDKFLTQVKINNFFFFLLLLLKQNKKIISKVAAFLVKQKTNAFIYFVQICKKPNRIKKKSIKQNKKQTQNKNTEFARPGHQIPFGNRINQNKKTD